MTDTTDIKALLNELRVTSTEKAGESEVARRVLILFDQLEAERQRADKAEARVAELEQVWPTGTPLRLVLDENISLKAKLDNPVVFPERKKASFYSDYQFSNKDLASVYNGAIREIKHKLHAAGFTVKE